MVAKIGHTSQGDSPAIRRLVSACRKGEHKAQMEIYERYFKAMFNTAFRIVGNNHVAEDLMQEAFLDAFQKMASYREESTFGSWLKRIVVNRCLNHLKKRRLETVSMEGHELPDNAEEPDPGFAFGKIDSEHIANAVNQLPTGYRTILSLYLLEGYDHQEIGQILSINAASSRSQYARAKQKLREMLQTNGE